MTDTLESVAGEFGSSAEKTEREGILASLKSEFRFIKWWEIEGFGLVVCRRMRRTEVLSFTKASAAAGKKFDATDDASELMNINESAVKTTCVWPKDREILKSVFDEYPSWSSGAAASIAQLGDEGITEGKG